MAASITNFNFTEMDWDAYERYRPAWPEELFEIIYVHHTKHADNLNYALDVGAGGGMVSKRLLSRCRHVTYSDASEIYVSQAKLRFNEALDLSQMSFLTMRFEDLAATDLPHGSTDLITAGECVHYADVKMFTTSMASLLSQNGTLAFFQHGLRVILPASDPAKEAYENASDKLLKLFAKLAHNPATLDSPATTKESRYDNIALDDELWKDVRRMNSCLSESICGAGILPASSRANKQTESFEELDDAFLSRWADYEWIENYMVNLYPPLNFRDGGRAELKQLQSAMGDRTVFLKWPLTLVLATKR